MRWLVDEMFPPEASASLRQLGHEAVSVYEVGLTSTADAAILGIAIREQRIVVTENVKDFVPMVTALLERNEPCVPVVIAQRANLARGGALPHHLARLLDTWAKANPEPHAGAYWL